MENCKYNNDLPDIESHEVDPTEDIIPSNHHTNVSYEKILQIFTIYKNCIEILTY